MKLFRGFAVAAAVLAFAIAVLGSWVRINHAGMTCPDWPLCNGKLVPSFAGGVIFEWSHRAIVLVESFVVLGAVVTGWRIRREIAGVTATVYVLCAVFLIQVLLGGATVFLSNSPPSVVLHWGAGMSLLASSTVLAVLSIMRPEPRRIAGLFRGDVATGTLVAAALAAFATMCVGAYVSSSNAGLACTTVPACNGGAPFGDGSTAQFVQMLHRLFAFASVLLAVYAACVCFATRANATVRGFALGGCALIVAQIALGIANVLWLLPIDLREAHAANAAATFLAFVLAATFAALEPHRATASAPERVAVRRTTSAA